MSVPMFASSLQADENADSFMLGMTFFYDPASFVNSPTAEAKAADHAKSLRRLGANIVTEYDKDATTHVVLMTTGVGAEADIYKRAKKERKRVVSWDWIEACIHKGELVPIDDCVLYHPPLTLDGHPDMADVRVCVTGYVGERRQQLINMCKSLGCEYMRVLDRKSTHLVCYEFEGAKWAKATQTGLQRIVSHRWLEECLRQWRRLDETPFATLSGKDEDAMAVAEVPDSQEPLDDHLGGDDEEARNAAAAGQNPGAGGRNSLGTFVTELTTGMAPAGEEEAPATAPRNTVLRQTVDAPRTGGTSGGSFVPSSGGGSGGSGGSGGKGMDPPAPRAPLSQRVASQPTPGGGSAVLSPDWNALEARPSQHIEVCDRNMKEDPLIREIRDSGARPPPELHQFTGRIGSPTDVEAAFGGRFIDRQPQRWHRFEDRDAPLAADSFHDFVDDVARGTWDPRPDADDDLDLNDKDISISMGEAAAVVAVLHKRRRFEVLQWKPGHVPAGLKLAPLRGGDQLAYLEDEASPEEISLWTALARDAAQKRDRGPLGAAVISRLRLESAKQPDACWEGEESPMPGPDALCVTFAEVYLPFGFQMSHEQIVRMYRPVQVRESGERTGTRLRIRDAGDVVTLPARVPGNLPGVTVHEVERPLSEVLVGFHELLAGPTEPDMTQAFTQMAPGSGAKTPAVPNAAATWSFDLGAKISIGAAAPGSRARIAAAAASCFGAGDTQEMEAEEEETHTQGEEEEEAIIEAPKTSGKKKSSNTLSAAKAAADAVQRAASKEDEEIHRDLAAELDECITQKQAEEQEEEEEEEEEEEIVVPRRGRARKLVIMTQDTGDKSAGAVAPGQETQGCAGALQELGPARPRRAARGKPAEPEPVKEKAPPKPKAAPKAAPKKTTPPEAKAAHARKNPARKKRTRETNTETDTETDTEPEPVPEKERRPRVALSGFSSADLTKYGSLVTRLGGTVCPGHGWDAAATHAVFGERGGRSLKFLAAAASGVPILDKSYLDASRRENALLPSAAFRAHLWRGGRGADMGLLTADASERWNAAAGRKAFEGLSVALAPFASKNREERDMLTVVLRCGGASVSSISAKGELVPANASPDVAVIDPSNKGALVGRAAGVVDAVAGGACVAPEFFKSWLSRPGADLGSHVLHGSLESGKLAASIRASLGGCGPAPPAPNARGASILTTAKAKVKAKKATGNTKAAKASERPKRKAAAAAEPEPARRTRRALAVKN